MKRVFKLGILLGFIFSLCTAAQAATTACKINGVVTDSISGEAIPFVTIGIENNEGKVLSRIASDELGKFMITASAGQNYRLVVSSVGYGTKYVDISLSENEKNKDSSQNVHTNIFCSWNNNYISSFISFFYLS